jgi:putative ABC transport system permease protein
MAVTGVVSLPGMMTGQILGGMPRAEAGQTPDPRHVPDRGWHRLGSGNGGASAAFTASPNGRHRLRLDRLTAPKATT